MRHLLAIPLGGRVPHFHPTKGNALRLLLFASALGLSVASTRANNTARAWGNNSDGQCNVPVGLTNVVAVAGGGLHSLALRGNGTVAVWGWNVLGETNVPTGLTNVIAIAANYGYSLALKQDGTVTAWGSRAATTPAGLSNVVAVAAGYDHKLALLSNGLVVSWGSTNLPPATLSNVARIAAGNGHSLALKLDGTVIAWGKNNFGQISVPPSVTDVAAVAAGDTHSLALLGDGTVRAWGDNSYGQTTVPAGLTNVVAIAAGSAHSLALRADGKLVAWGRNDYSQAQVPSSLNGVVGISGGMYHTLALVGDGSPVITGQPVNQIVPITQNARFRVLAAGSQPVSFQWQRSGTNLAGATSSVYPIPNVQWADAGAYRAVVFNAYGFVTSAPAMLTPLGLPPWIVTQPVDRTILCGESVTFNVVADGPPAFSYQWAFEGVDLPDATHASLSLTLVGTNQAGRYHVAVSNPYGTTNSRPAMLTVIPPSVTVLPQSAEVRCGEGVAFTATPAGVAPFSYQWVFEGVAIEGATNSTLILNSVTPRHAGRYSVTVSNVCCPFSSVDSVLTVLVDPPQFTSPLIASGSQGVPFTYTITGTPAPSSFSAFGLPGGLSLNPTNGVIQGIPLESGVFYVSLGIATECASASQVLTLTLGSSAPVITSPLHATGLEGADFAYQILAANAPSSFGVVNLPLGLRLNAATGLISGQPVYPGDFFATISASNLWGVGTATLHFTFTNRLITGLAIADVTFNYSAPFLLDFQFALRDNEDPALASPVVVNPTNLVVICKENERAISPTEAGTLLSPGAGIGKLVKVNLVLDFSQSIASLSNGDTNFDGISDAVDTMVQSAQEFVNQLTPGSLVGVFEFHRDDLDPQQVIPLTADKALVNEAIAGIWTNYVQWFPAGSRCWDALVAAVGDLGAANPDEQHYIVFVSDGRDESSLATVRAVIDAATNNNVRIYGIGFGAELDPTDLQDITTATSGRYLTAANVADLAAEFAEIGKDIGGQYLLRWVTLKRGETAFMPSFEIRYQGFTALSPTNPWSIDSIDTNSTPPVTNYVTNFIIGPFVPAEHSGNLVLGKLRLVRDAEIGATTVTLRATYVPRYIRRLRLHYRANWPCTTTLLSTSTGEVLHGWTMTETDDGAGGRWLDLASPHPQSLASSLPFGMFGGVVRFSFRDLQDTGNAFSILDLDNNIYATTGGQSFMLENPSEFVAFYPPLPFGTPVPWLVAHGFTTDFEAAELSDPDSDGAPTWYEYRTDTDPRNASSVFTLQAPARTGLYEHYQFSFNTSSNRAYRVETSTDLLLWQTLLDNITGTGQPMTVTDPRGPWNSMQTYYRVLAW